MLRGIFTDALNLLWSKRIVLILTIAFYGRSQGITLIW